MILIRLLDAVLGRFGKADILINGAGKIKRAPTLTVAEDEWTEILNTNLTGTLRACRDLRQAPAATRLRPHRQHCLAE